MKNGKLIAAAAAAAFAMLPVTAVAGTNSSSTAKTAHATNNCCHTKATASKAQADKKTQIQPKQ